MENTLTENEITLYEITKANLVLPIVVSKNRVASLLSTGSYFESEYDAAYFVSAQMPKEITPEIIIKNSHDFINSSDSDSNENDGESPEFELRIIDQLEPLIPVHDDVGNSNPWKWIYGIGGLSMEIIYKRRAHIDEIPLSHEHESLKGLLQMFAGLDFKFWSELADHFIENLEFEKATEHLISKEEVKETTNLANHVPGMPKVVKTDDLKDQNEIKHESLNLLNVEDIRGKDVYFMDNGQMIKGIITRYMLNVPTEGAPHYHDINVHGYSKGNYNFDNINDFSFTKEDFIKKLAKMVNDL